MLMMLGPFMACARSRTADADDARWHAQGAEQLMLAMLVAFVAWARSRTADADDAQCVWRTGRKQTS